MKHSIWTQVSVKKALLPVLFFAALCLAVMPADAQQAQQQPEQAKGDQKTGDVPKIKFDEQTHDFGKVQQNTPVKYSFTFKNVGKGKLIIENVKAS
jgi:hypothetical protein